ncbi:uncharacterized protein [Argopecten irradians]|uniref:uncharacterized protein isoform X2 n=1 Tax=Argopecten irradians TaxID=31199 RepID=UPI0037241CE7
MDSVITLLLLSTLITIAITDRPVRPPFFCLAEKNRYYHKQLEKCKPCDKCLVGEETDLSFEVEMTEYGAMKCKPCKTCSPGTYNPRRAFKCKPCRNCTAEGRAVKVACAPDRKEVCGKRIKSSISSSTQEPTTEIISWNPERRHHDNSPHESHSNYDLNEHKLMSNKANISRVIILLVIFIAVMLTIGFVVFLRYRGYRQWSKCSENIIYGISPIIDPESNTCSIASGVRPYIPQYIRVSDGITNTVAVDHNGGDESFETSETSDDQDTYHSTCSNGQYRYTAIGQNDDYHRQIDNNKYEEFSDVEVDSPTVVIDYSNTLDPTMFTAASPTTENDPTNNPIPHDIPSADQVSEVISGDERASTGSPRHDIPSIEQDAVASPLEVTTTENKNINSNKGKSEIEHRELMQHAIKLSKYLAPERRYRDLGRHLNISTTDIDIIEEDHTQAKERAYRTLAKAIQCNPGINIADINQAVSDIGGKDILRKIRS